MASDPSKLQKRSLDNLDLELRGFQDSKYYKNKKYFTLFFMTS